MENVLVTYGRNVAKDCLVLPITRGFYNCIFLFAKVLEQVFIVVLKYTTKLFVEAVEFIGSEKVMKGAECEIDFMYLDVDFFCM